MLGVGAFGFWDTSVKALLHRVRPAPPSPSQLAKELRCPVEPVSACLAPSFCPEMTPAAGRSSAQPAAGTSARRDTICVSCWRGNPAVAKSSCLHQLMRLGAGGGGDLVIPAARGVTCTPLAAGLAAPESSCSCPGELSAELLPVVPAPAPLGGARSARWAPCRLPFAGLRVGAPLLLLPGVGPRPAHTRTSPSM